MPALRASLAVAAVLASSGPVQGATEVEAGLARERLDHGLPAWKAATLDAAHELRPRTTVYGTLREIERFGQRDTQLGGGGYLPLGSSWIVQGEALFSSEHHVLPESSVFAGAAATLGGGWIANAGLRRNEYTSTGARVVSLGLERYWGNWRGAYTIYSGRPDGAGSASAHRFQVDRYYAGRSSVGASFVTGREVENTGPALGVLTSDVTALELGARHWLSPRWALSAGALVHRQGDLYERRGVRLGLRHRF